MIKFEKKVIFLAVFAFVLQMLFPQYTHAFSVDMSTSAKMSLLAMSNLDDLVMFDADGKGSNRLSQSDWKKPRKVVRVAVTAYSSTVDQCDGDPFTTANGKHVKDGFIAGNFLRFGTKVKIPSLYGDKIFSVEDRMNARYDRRLDIWMETREEAKKFGVKYVEVEIY